MLRYIEVEGLYLLQPYAGERSVDYHQQQWLELEPPLFRRFKEGSRTISNLQAYKASVIQEVTAMLNTRSSFPASDLAVNPRRTVLDYGLVDFVHLSPHSKQDGQVLAAWIKKTIDHYEPRLRVSSVSIGIPRPTRSSLCATVEGMLLLQRKSIEEIHFPVFIGQSLLSDRFKN